MTTETTQARAADWFDEAKLREFLKEAPKLVPPIRPLNNLLLAWPQLRALMDEPLAVLPESCYLRRDARERGFVGHLYDFDELTHEHRKMTLLAAWFWQAVLAVETQEAVNEDLLVRRVKTLARAAFLQKRSRDAKQEQKLSRDAKQEMRRLADLALRPGLRQHVQQAILLNMFFFAWRDKQACLTRLEQHKAWQD